MIAIPTFTALYNGIIADLETQYGVSISPIGKSFLRALAAVQAGKLKLFYLVLGNVQKNIFADTADSETVGGTLERFGRVKLGRNPFAATAGQYTVTITGSIGAIIKASTTFKSDDTSLNPGFLFILDDQYTLVATTDTITLRALTAGTVSKLEVADTLTCTIPIALVDKTASVATIAVEPLSAETIEEYRTAVLDSWRLETQGGAATDYRLWSRDAQGVASVYPYAKTGAANEINLFVEATIANSTDGKGTPSALMLDAVEAVVEFNPDTSLPLLERGRRPLGVFEVHYLPVTIKEIDIVISGYVPTPDATVEALLLAAITSLITGIRPFVAAADILNNKNDILDINRIVAAILVQKPGAVFTSVTMSVAGVSLSTYTFTNGDIPHLNSVTYV